MASSGVSCPGLIEGFAWGCERLQSSRPHPGFLAPASLKAGYARVGEREHPRPHPGFLAPASLKEGSCSSAMVTREASSGVSCPGLIEGVNCDLSIQRLRASSGVSCPGLIEGRCLPGPQLPSVRSSSGVSCPGLIEGSEPDRDPPTGPGLLIRGFLPRPH